MEIRGDQDHKFKRLPYFKYLESIMSQDNDLKIEVNNILQIGNGCYYGLRSIFGSKILSKGLF